jgi:effector-binding domain-containing protein
VAAGGVSACWQAASEKQIAIVIVLNIPGLSLRAGRDYCTGHSFDLAVSVSNDSPVNRILKITGGVVLALVVIGLLLPARARVEREITIDAHRATVFTLLNDFRQINRFAPIAEGDPNARVDFGGVPAGVGATASWSGTIIGRGTEAITESEPFSRIVTRIEYGNGRVAGNRIVLSSDDGQTGVVQVYERNYGVNLAGRYFGLFLDRIVGPGIERNLVRLADYAERLPRADFSDLEVDRLVVDAADIAYLPTRSRPDAEAISEAMGRSFFDILDFIDRHDLAEAGAPMSITRSFSGSDLVFDAAIPVSGISPSTPVSSEAVKIGKTYAGVVIRVRHVGGYSGLGRTHDKIAAYLAARGLERNGDAWESYVSDPGRTDESGLLTYIYYPIRE